MPSESGLPERLGASAKRRRDSLYEDQRDQHFEASRSHPTRHSMLRWDLGVDPNDDEAQPGSGWSYLNLEGAEREKDRPASPFEGMTGTPSGITCFECKRQEFLVMDERTAEESIAGDVELSWAAKNNRPLDPYRASAKLMLFCSGCKTVAQVIEQVFKAMQAGGMHH